MPHGQSSKAGNTALTGVIKWGHAKRRLQFGIIGLNDAHAIGERVNFVDQFTHLRRSIAIVQRRHDLDRLLEPLKVSFELFLDVCVKHVVLLSISSSPSLHGQEAKACLISDKARPNRCLAMQLQFLKVPGA
uniref:Uncharacterized protein n=1 Tax=uncultured organism TaxID=155900 RepID=A0A8K2AUQ3_9ZZZZ|nr:hypothetical protein [uncultured organism]